MAICFSNVSSTTSTWCLKFNCKPQYQSLRRSNWLIVLRIYPPLFEADNCFDCIQNSYRDTVVFIDPLRRQLFIYALQYPVIINLRRFFMFEQIWSVFIESMLLWGLFDFFLIDWVFKFKSKKPHLLQSNWKLYNLVCSLTNKEFWFEY